MICWVCRRKRRDALEQNPRPLLSGILLLGERRSHSCGDPLEKIIG